MDLRQKIELVGGPNDGALVPYVGSVYCEAVLARAILPVDEVGPPVGFEHASREYVLRCRHNGRMVYVLSQLAYA